MKTNKHAALLLSTFAVVLSLSAVSFAQKNGGFKPIEKTDPGAGLAADFAVKERSAKTKTKVRLGGIVNAEDRELQLMTRDFRLCMNVTVNGKPSSARAVVSMDQYSNFKLVSWAKSTCHGTATAVDGFKPIQNGDGGAGLAADFAVKEQSAKTKAKITPATIVKAEDQEPQLGYRNFRLCLKTTVNGAPSTVQVVVSMDQYSNFKLLSWAKSTCGN